MKSLNDIVTEAEALDTSLQAMLADLQAFAAAPTAAVPVQATVAGETITFSDGTVITFDGSAWSVSTPPTA